MNRHPLAPRRPARRDSLPSRGRRCWTLLAIAALIPFAPARAGEIAVVDVAPPPPPEFDDGFIDFAESVVLVNLELADEDVEAVPFPLIGLQASGNLAILEPLDLAGQDLELGSLQDIFIDRWIEGVGDLYVHAESGSIGFGSLGFLGVNGAATLVAPLISFSVNAVATSGDLTMDGDVTFEGGSGHDLSAGGNLFVSGAVTKADAGNVSLDAGAVITIDGPSIDIQGGDLVLDGEVDIAGDVTVAGDVTFGFIPTTSIGGNLVAGGTVTGPSGTGMVFDGAGDQSATAGATISTDKIWKTTAGNLHLVAGTLLSLPVGIEVSDGDLWIEAPLDVDEDSILAITGDIVISPPFSPAPVTIGSDMHAGGSITFDLGEGPVMFDRFLETQLIHAADSIIADTSLVKSTDGAIEFIATSQILLGDPDVSASALVDGSLRFSGPLLAEGDLLASDEITLYDIGEVRGDVTAGIGVTLDTNVTLSGAGDQAIAAGDQVLLGGDVIKITAGALTLAGAGTTEVLGDVFVVAGDLAFDGPAAVSSSVLSAAGTISFAADVLFNQPPSLGAAQTVFAGQVEIVPGAAATLSISGSGALSPASSLVMEIGGSNARDQVFACCPGDVQLGGELVLSILPGDPVAPDDEFEIVVAEGVIGTFSVVSSPVPVEVTYEPARVVVRVAGVCPADINGDGLINIQDLLQILAAWGPCTGCPEDLDGNGIVDILDLLALLASWGACA